MKILYLLTAIFILLTLAASKPQFQNGAFSSTGSRFPRTKYHAAPPVDLSRPLVFLPEATPIHEPPQEPPRRQSPSRPVQSLPQQQFPAWSPVLPQLQFYTAPQQLNQVPHFHVPVRLPQQRIQFPQYF